MIVAGVMSGTSADGIDVAITRIQGRGFNTGFELLRHEHYSYPTRVRHLVLELMNAGNASVAQLSRLNFLLGELYAEAVLKTQRAAKVELELVGCHGQTIYHQGEPRDFLGKKIGCTWQTGEGAVIAARVEAAVVSDFRPADMALGGKGAPLVPFLDYLLFRHRRRGRIVLNLGGIANLTAIPPQAELDKVIAFDVGPGNMVIDSLAERLFGRAYDRDGALAGRGKVQEATLRKLLAAPFFRQAPPRTAGREQFGREFARDFMRYFKSGTRPMSAKEDVMATATAFTAVAIADAINRFVFPRSPKGKSEDLESWDLIVSGGGSRNRTLMRMIAEHTGLRAQISDDFGLPSQAKEAVAFAVLAYQTWNRQPGNIPSATGARRAAVLGKISLP